MPNSARAKKIVCYINVIYGAVRLVLDPSVNTGTYLPLSAASVKANSFLTEK